MAERIQFSPFELDPNGGLLWRDGATCTLRPKPLEVLHYLVKQAGKAVSKEELLQSIWPDTVVSDGVLKRHIRELRHVLGDDSHEPRFIETLPREGYRFIAEIGSASMDSEKTTRGRGTTFPDRRPQATTLVGRDEELTFLNSCLEQATQSQRQLVFVTGEPGIGKTSLVQEFIDQVDETGETLIARGQCVEQYGSGEAYLPILEAFERLGRQDAGGGIISLLRRQAPSWLVQMPSLIDPEELAALQRRAVGMSQERMLREMASAMEVLTRERPFVLWLEDLHWCDHSTVDLLAALAQRQQPARFVVIGTYRPEELSRQEHPLRGVVQELQGRGQCLELPLQFLNTEDVGNYLAQRFSPSGESKEMFRSLAQPLHAGTDGNPLFMVTVVEDLVAQGTIATESGGWAVQAGGDSVEIGVPENLQQILGQQIDRLASAEQQTLEVASVAGAEFSAALVAVGLEEDVEEVEDRCDILVDRGQLLRANGFGTFPDGTISGQYMFAHALYQNVLYERLGAARRVRLHKRIGEAEETAYGEQTVEVAGELAMHFERGQDLERAVRYRQQAGESALRRSAVREAINHLTIGLELLLNVELSEESVKMELMLRATLGPALIAAKGYASPEVEENYTRARMVCQMIGDVPQLFPVLWGLWAFYYVRGELHQARDLGEQLVRLAEQAEDTGLLLEAKLSLGLALFFLGELIEGRGHLEEAHAIYNKDEHHVHVFSYAQDPGMSVLVFGSWALWMIGKPDTARAEGQESIQLAAELAHPLSQAMVSGFMANLYWTCGDVAATQEHAEAAIAVSTEFGFALYLAIGVTLRGCALFAQGKPQEGIEQMQQGLAGWQATGGGVTVPYYQTFLAEAYGKIGEVDKGLAILEEAQAQIEKNDERIHESRVAWLKGLLLTQKAEQAENKHTLEEEAEACFQHALSVSRQQEAKSLELNAAMGLAQLWQKQGKTDEARKLVEPIYSWFTEGFDTADLNAAKRLLESLS